MRGKAFTLIEVLLVSALMATLSLAVFTCLANGLEMWKKARAVNVEEDIVIFFDRISTDLRNSFLFSTLPLDGQEYLLDIPTIVSIAADKYGNNAPLGIVDQIGMARYRFDPATGEMTRQQAGYPDALKKQWSAPQVLLRDVSEVRFRYFLGNSREHQAHVKAQEGLPSDVEVLVRWGRGEDQKETACLIAVPLGI